MFLTKDIHSTYKRASDPVKRHFLRFFYESFIVEDKMIVEAKPTPISDALLGANMVRLRPIVLPLVDMFTNREIEFGFTLQNIQTVFDTFQIQPIYAT